MISSCGTKHTPCVELSPIPTGNVLDMIFHYRNKCFICPISTCQPIIAYIHETAVIDYSGSHFTKQVIANAILNKSIKIRLILM
jgi:hypothetical protein